MEALRTHHIGEGGDMHMESALTDIDGKIGRDVKEVYVGPSALWIAKLIPRRVSFSQGWFWTTTEICHEGRSDGLAFRQRPDGNGIDVRCHTRGCSRDVAMAGLETATGLSIQNAYAPTGRPVDRLWWLKHWPWERLAWWGTAALAFAAPLLVGHRVAGRHPQLPRIRHRLVADGSVAAATPCQEVLALTAGASGLDHNPLKARVGSSTGSALLLCPQAGAIGKATKQRHLRRCTMTTATVATGNRTMATVVRPRRSLEELVDQLFAAMGFKDETETAEPSPTRSIHEARRLRQAGQALDGALAVFAGMDMAKATTREARWAYTEWKQLVKRRFGDRDVTVYRQGAGRAAALVPRGDGTLEVAAVLGMRWRPGKVVSERSLRGLRPLGRACP